MQDAIDISSYRWPYRQRHLWFSVLVLLDGFMLGGLATSFMIRNLILERCCGAIPMNMAVYNLLDHLVFYYVFFGGALLLLAIITVGAWFADKALRRGKSCGQG